MNNSFRNFLESKPINVPPVITDKILTRTRNDLHPSVYSVASKLFGIHLVMGTLSLLMCAHFGISAHSKMGVMGSFMQFGEVGCMIACGIIFIIGTVALSVLVLSIEQLKVIRDNSVLLFTLLASLSLGAFVCIGTELMLYLAAIWFISVLITGTLLVEIGLQIRKILIA